MLDSSFLIDLQFELNDDVCLIIVFSLLLFYVHTFIVV